MTGLRTRRLTSSPTRLASPTRTGALAATTIATLLLTACSAPPSHHDATPVPDTSPGHGAVAGATEAPEPPLHLVTVDSAGNAALLDLLDGTATALEAVRAPTSVTTDGRYAFVANESGTDIIDSGVWTWDHVDHFHYYRSAPSFAGSVTGRGTATVATGMLATAGSTGLFFPESGEAVLLDNAELSRGSIVETLRIDASPHRGLIAPLGTGALMSVAQTGGGDVTDASEPTAAATLLRALDADGAELDTIACPNASGTITTRLALVVGCTDGAVLATADTDGSVTLDKVAYPAGAAAPATEFSARKGRPTVAGLGTDAGVWLLDTRERSWSWVPTPERPVEATAVDDAAEHIVTVTSAGAVSVLDASGAQIGSTAPLITLCDGASHADASFRSGSAAQCDVSLTADAQRAYVNDPQSGAVYEIDYADHARIARTLTPMVPAQFLAETGR